MEKMRMKIDQGGYHNLVPLGRSKSGKGVVSEDLGRTEFKTSSKTNGCKPSKNPRANAPKKDVYNDSDEDDDLDLLSHASSPPPTAAVHTKSKASKSQPSTEVPMKPSSSRAKVKARPNFQGAKQLDTREKNKQSPRNPSRMMDHSASPLEELNFNRIKRPKIRKGKHEPQPFPMQAECHAPRSEIESHSSKRPRSGPAPFPMPLPSPIRSTHTSSSSHFFTPSPPKVQSISGKNSITRCTPQCFPLDTAPSDVVQGMSGDEGNDSDELALTDDDVKVITPYGSRPRPFPMSISQPIPETIDEGSGSKRCADDRNEQRTNKRSRPSPEPNTVGDLSSLSLEGDTNVDPTSICPYCDEPWPSAPSPTLLSLLERTKRKSYTDPRPGNVLGLKAPLAVFVELCQRHRFEMTHLPLALERGWPTRLEFSGLPRRIKGFRKSLRRFIDHPIESQFWREIKDDAKEVGGMRVVSVSGQYATFERSQPGYYGEQGSIIIHQTLYSLFPLDEISLASVDPLTPDQFLSRVLVPETATLLIQEDMHLPTKEEALRVLDESKKYGLAMFPEQAQGEEAAEIGEQLARERAKERRRVLEQRGEADADVKRQVERERRQAKKARRRDGFQSDTEVKETATESESDTGHRREEEVSIVKARLKGRDKYRGVPLWDSPDEPTPRPLRGRAVTREPSTASWRSRCSSSSPDSHDGLKPASRSSTLQKLCYQSTSSPPRQSTQQRNQDSGWTFDLRDVSPSPDREDVDLDEMTAIYEAHEHSTKAAVNSDSDVMVMEDDLTPKSKPKPKLSRAVHRPVANNSSDSDVSSVKATPKLAHKQRAERKEHQDVAGSGARGKAKK